jgi:hypothetical protein
MIPAASDFYESAGFFVGAGGLLIAAIGIVIGVLIARRAPNLVFYQEGQVVLRAQRDAQVEVRWKGQEVPAYSRTRTRTRIWIWNAGSTTLDRTARVRGFPLRLEWPDDSQVLAIQTILSPNVANGCEFTRSADGRAVEFEFEYLDRNHGVVIEVEHTASVWKATATGTLKGAKKTLRERMPRKYYTTGRWWPYLLALVLRAALVVVALASKHPRGDWTGAGVSAGAILLIAVILWESDVRPAPPRRLRDGRDSKLVEQRYDSSGHVLPK